MKANYLLFLIYTALFSCSPLFAEKPNVRFESLMVKDGLAQNSVYAIAQDSYGFMWFGTAEGLSKFNGYDFVTYKLDTHDSTTISENWVTCLFNDRKGRLWVGTNGGGVNVYDSKTDRFTRYVHNPQDSNSISYNVIYAIHEDYKGKIWIGTDNGLNRFIESQGIFERFYYDPENPNSVNSNMINCISEDNIGNLWIGTNRYGLDKYDRDTNKFIHHIHDANNSESISNDIIWGSIQDDDVLWIATYGGLNKYSYKTNSFKHFPHSGLDKDLNIRAFLKDEHGCLWLGTRENGLWRFDPEDETFQVFKRNPNDHLSISQNHILSLFQDQAGLIWIGTRRGGVNKLHQSNFQHLKDFQNSENEASSNFVWSIFYDTQNTLWIGTDLGLVKKSENSDLYFTYSHKDDDPYSLSDNNVTAIFEDSKLNLWVGTSQGGLNLFDRKKNKFFHYRHDPENPTSISSDQITQIYEDQQNKLWIVTRGGGLNLFNPQTKSFTNYLHKTDNPNSISHNRLNTILEDYNGLIWVGTSGGGLNLFNRKTEAFVQFTHKKNVDNSLSDIYVLSLAQDAAGTLWVGTYNGGLNRFNREDSTFTTYTEKDGLANNVVYGILPDDQGYLWLSTNHGISRFHPESETFTNFDINNGLQGNEFNIGSCFKSRKGEMFFGGINGITRFFPRDITISKFIPPIVLTSFNVFDKNIPLGPFLDSKHEIELPYDQNFFSFEFASLDFTFPSKNKYKYRLLGLEEEWKDPGSRRYASYSNIGGGNYQLQIIGTNRDGIWNKQGFSLNIKIIPPLWKSWWFKIVAIFLVSMSIIVTYKLRVHNIKKHNLELQKEINARIQVEQTLATERERLDVTLRSINEGVIATDWDFTVLYLNKIAEALTGLSNEEAHGKTIDFVLSLIDEKTNELFKIPTHYIFETSQNKVLPEGLYILTKDKQKIYLEASGAPILDSNEKPIGIVFVLRDITQKRQMEQELLKTEKLEAIGILAGGIAHDFNNILTAIIGNASLAKFVIDSKSQVLELLNEVEDASLRAKDLTFQLLTFSKGGNPIKSAISLGKLIKESTIFILRGSNVKCEFDIAENLWAVEADKGQLSQVIYNLVINADQAMKSGGQLTISAHNIVTKESNKMSLPMGKYVKISIADEGPGIPPENLKKIFDPYFTTKKSGNGLGLATAYSIINKHEGLIWVQSKPGYGSTFEIYLPATQKPLEEQKKTDIVRRSKGGKVLVMDDDKNIITLLSNILKHLGFSVETAIDGEQAIQLYQKAKENGKKFDLVILDLTIPGGMGGEVTIAHLKKFDPDVKALVSSGYSNDRVVAEYNKYGFAGVVSKPYKVEEIASIINTVLKPD